MTTPSRIPFVRTPDTAFAVLPGYPWPERFIDRLPALAGLRMHYLDEGPRDAPVTWLCLHGNPAWSYLYRKMIPVFLAAGHRVVAPDLPGFGKSDKPLDEAAHTFSWHRQVLLEFVEALELRAVRLVVQDWGGLLGLTLPMHASHRYQGLLVMNTLLATGEVPLPEGFTAWRRMCADKPEFSIGRLFARGNPQMTPHECAAYDAPFPSSQYRAATRTFPRLVPESPGDDGAAVSREAVRFWRETWNGRSLMAIGDQDPVFAPALMDALASGIQGCPPPIHLPQAGHFVQEHGEPVARAALAALAALVAPVQKA